ncbi:Phosphate acetyltransferase [Dermatophilus congolensis]|uniref:Phosphate acetyltransferase n=1 Tax=Dermatophilus congolensis TaxID=1863 RepID=A0AA46BMR4_9MICO|nr:phosphate acetyltransferase [Dermatophilus congolensis]STD08087.1 Phosphate acetyltransferase [Dermatophilus congolensis]
MSRRILVVPANHAAGVKAVCHGLLHALDERGVEVGYIKPLAGPDSHGTDTSAQLVSLVTALQPPTPIPGAHIDALMSRNLVDSLMEEVVELAEPVLSDHEVVIIEGLAQEDEAPWADDLNAALARTLDAEVVLVVNGSDRTPEHVAERLGVALPHYQIGESSRVVGVVLNRLPSSTSEATKPYTDAVEARELRVIATITQDPTLAEPRMKDVADQLGLESVNPGDSDRRVKGFVIGAQAIPGALPHLKEGHVLIAPGDRHDILMAACLAELNGTKLAGIVLSAGIGIDPAVATLCGTAMSNGLPIYMNNAPTYETSYAITHLSDSIPTDDEVRVRRVMESVSSRLEQSWIDAITQSTSHNRLSPAAFRRQLTTLAARANKRIVLPEGSEPRTVDAAITCHEKGIARCVLLAPRSEVEAVAASLGRTLPEDIEIIDPAEPAKRYVDALVERRKHKGMTEAMAKDALGDTVVLGTMMLHLDEVDGLVSGAVHTTANTIRPALQILGTKPGASLVSSVFFMGLPDEVLVYGDCAVNPDPNADQLADIAIQSADSAKAFGLDPRVAMISFSTGSSGSGADIEKVKAATERIHELRPDILVDGPLQYDAATTTSVAQSKAPESPVAGQANVFVFPDLNTGNTTYKAVQRSASVISIGPMLQGIAKPVNDLSRGALVEDIVYTIALTSIQADAQ